MVKLLLLPGLAGRAAEFDALIGALAPARAVTSEALDPPPGGITEQADAYARAAGAGPYVVAGHSQGGIVALEMARRYPVAGVILLDTPVAIPVPARRALAAVLAALPRAWWPAALRRFTTATFTSADDPAWRAEVLDRLAATPVDAARRLVRETFAYEALPALAALTVPALYVRANIPTPLHRLPPGVTGAAVTGVGHWAHVHRPDEVADVMRGFLSAAGESPGTSGAE